MCKSMKNRILSILTIFSIFVCVGMNVYAENLKTTSSVIKVGMVLTEPMEGWTRFGNSEPSISYSEDWSILPSSYAWGNSVSDVRTASNSTIKFNFTGEKLLILGVRADNRSRNIQVNIDNNRIKETFSQYNNGDLYNTVDYIFTGLSNEEHTVVITVPSEGACLVAVDIGENEEIKPYNPYSVTNILLNKQELLLEPGQSETLIATIVPQNAINKNVVWSSNNDNIVRVDQNGKVTAFKEGETVVTAKTEDGDITAICRIIVKAVESNRGILNVSLSNGVVKEYDLSIDNINDFINWYDSRSRGEGKNYFMINKAVNIAPFLSRKDYLIFNSICMFEVKEYKVR